MRSTNETEVFRAALDTYGIALQQTMLFEEMSELQKEVCKMVRGIKGRTKNHLAEEIADVEIMLEQMKLHYGIDDDVEMWRLDKVVRLKQRLGLMPDE